MYLDDVAIMIHPEAVVAVAAADTVILDIDRHILSLCACPTCAAASAAVFAAASAAAAAADAAAKAAAAAAAEAAAASLAYAIVSKRPSKVTRYTGSTCAGLNMTHSAWQGAATLYYIYDIPRAPRRFTW